MQKICLLLSLAGAVLLCGCDKQAKINNEKIELLAQNIIQFEQNQSKQMAVIQSEQTSLAPMLDKMNNSYFEKNRDDALFFHTNTLFLLLTIGKQIESQLQAADTEREMESSLLHSYHTNEMDRMHSDAAQIQGAMAGQESRVEDEVNAETRRVAANLSNELLKQIKLSAPDEVEIARHREMEADIAQIRRDLDQIKTQIGQITNQPAIRP
jgi:hypothetical protein